LIYGRIARIFIDLPFAKLHCHWCGNWSALVHSELHQDFPNVAVLLDVHHGMLSIDFEVHDEIGGDTPDIMHPEHLLPLIHQLPNAAR